MKVVCLDNVYVSVEFYLITTALRRNVLFLPKSSQVTSVQKYTALFIHSFAMFRNVCLCELRGPAWAVCSQSSGPPAGGIPQILIF